MKAKKALLPILASVLALAMGLAACGAKPADKPSGDNQSQQGSGEEEVKINITADGDKKELVVGDTLQLHADVDGVEWSTKSESITVSNAGLVTAVAPGSASVTAKKDGYANGRYSLTVVKAPAKPWQYEVRLEQADHYDPDDFWGMDLSAYGYGIMGPGDSPIENNNGATDDSTSLGYLQTGCKETMTFTCDKAVEVELGVTMAYNAETALQGVIAVKFNNVDIPMTGISCEGPEDGNNQNYYDFHAVSFGKVNLIAGNNVLEIEVLGQVAPNMDKVVIWTDQTLQIAAVPAVAKPKIEVVEAELTVEVESKVQIQVKDNLAGVEFKSADETIATVSATGEVTGVKAGRTSIELTKEGYKKASVTVTVKNKPVAGQIILEAEEGTLGGTARVENDANASGGARVGYLSADTSLTLKTTLTEAGDYTASFMAYSNNVSDWSTYPNVTAEELVLSSCMTLTLNGTPIDLTGKVLPGGAWGTWVSVELGDLSLSVGENTFVFAFTAQGPNIDYLKLVNKNGGQVEPPVVEQVTVSFDGDGATDTMADVKVDKGSEYTLPANGFTAPTGKEFVGWLITTVTQTQWGQQTSTQMKQPGDKITVSANITIKAGWQAIVNKTAAVDLTSAYYADCEDGDLAGGARAEANGSAHNAKSVGYMAAGASIKVVFDASAAGKAKLVLLGCSAIGLGDWHQVEGGAYAQTNFNHALQGTTKIEVNGVELTVSATAGFLASDGVTMTQIDLGEIDVNAGKNEITITALAQAPNFDAVALVSSSITFSEHVEADPEGMAVVEMEDGEFVRPEGKDETNALVIEDNAKAHGKKSVGYFVQGSKITVKFYASAAGKVNLKLVGASGSATFDWSTYSMKVVDQDLSTCMSMELNGSDLDLTGKVLPGNNESNYYNWQEVDFGDIDVQLGENIVVLEASAQGPNLDCLKIQGTASVSVALTAF